MGSFSGSIAVLEAKEETVDQVRPKKRVQEEK
jgi:hypothetical protein